jgi:hypothetical protein
MVKCVDGISLGDEVIYQVFVASAVLSQAVSDKQHSLGFFIRQPVLVIEFKPFISDEFTFFMIHAPALQL